MTKGHTLISKIAYNVKKKMRRRSSSSISTTVSAPKVVPAPTDSFLLTSRLVKSVTGSCVLRTICDIGLPVDGT